MRGAVRWATSDRTGLPDRAALGGCPGTHTGPDVPIAGGLHAGARRGTPVAMDERRDLRQHARSRQFTGRPPVGGAVRAAPDGVLALQRAAGNAAVTTLLRKGPDAPDRDDPDLRGRAAVPALPRGGGNAAVARWLETSPRTVQRKWVAQAEPQGVSYHHHTGGARDSPPREYKHVFGVSFVDDVEDKVWSERRDEGLYERHEFRATFAGTPYGTRPVGQSSSSFNFAMRLSKMPPDGLVVASSQKLLDRLETRWGLKGRKVGKAAFAVHPLANRAGTIRGRTFLYLPGVVKTRRAKVPAAKTPTAKGTAAKGAAAKGAAAKAEKQQQAAKVLKKASLPLGAASASPKTATATFTAPAAKAGRSSTAGAFGGVSAGVHAGAHNGLLPPAVQPASSRRWEWLHLVGDALGGPTVHGNLAAGTFDSNSRHNAIEEAVSQASQTATPVDPLTYEVEATLIAGTEIATEFRCRAKRPSHNSGAWVAWQPVDTLTTTKEDVVEDALRRHGEHRTLTK